MALTEGEIEIGQCQQVGLALHLAQHRHNAVPVAGLAQVAESDGRAGESRRVTQHGGIELHEAHAGLGQTGEIEVETTDAIDRQGEAERRQAAEAVETGAVEVAHAFIGEFQHDRSEEHTSELQSLMRISYAVFCLKKKRNKILHQTKKKNGRTTNI